MIQKVIDRAIVLFLIVAAVCLVFVAFPGLASMNTLRGIVAPYATWDPDAMYDGNYLHGGSFRDSYADLGASGSLAEGWTDQSQSDGKPVRYSEDYQAARAGGKCQRVEIPAGGHWRIEQYRILPWGGYRASIWMRSSDKIPVVVSVNEASSWQPILVDKVLVRGGWKRYDISGFANTWGPATISIGCDRPGTLWLQDARLSMTGGGFAGVIGIAIACLAVLAGIILAARYWVVSGGAAATWEWAKTPRRQPSRRPPARAKR